MLLAISYFNSFFSSCYFYRPPTDCFQWFTGTGGTIKSFNFPDQMIKNQEYQACIRRVDGRTLTLIVAF